MIKCIKSFLLFKDIFYFTMPNLITVPIQFLSFVWFCYDVLSSSRHVELHRDNAQSYFGTFMDIYTYIRINYLLICNDLKLQ